MNNEMMQRIAKEVIDSLPENSPLRPYIKDGGDLSLVAMLMAILFMPTEEMKRIAQNAMNELQEAET